MPDAKDVLERQFLEMRWRCLSLAADLDRVERAGGGAAVLSSDARLQKLREAMKVLTGTEGNRAERVQMLFSDKSRF